MVLERRAAKRYDAESITLAAKLLEQNPEVYTVWNYRREDLADTFKVGYSWSNFDLATIRDIATSPTSILLVLQGGEGLKEAVDAIKFELKLTESALHKNPKSYATWHHRKWLVDQGVVPLKQELQLLGK